MPKIDMSGAGDGFDPIPAGTYRFWVTGAEERTVKEDGQAKEENKGKPFARWELTVADGEFENRKVWASTMFFGDGRYLLKQLLVAAGVRTKEEAEADDLDFEYEEVIGSQVCGVVKVRKSEQYGGSNNISKFMSAEEPTSEEKGESVGAGTGRQPL